MGTRIPTVFLIALFHTTSVGAQQDQCLELVRLSRMKTQTIMSQSQFTSTVDAYCEERSNSSAEAVSAGVSGYSASASRAEASYGKFCSKDTDDRGSESDYNEYMEGLQPGAYAAYAACTAARNSDGVQFEMSAAPTRDRLVLGIYNRTNTRGTADMQWDGSDPVTCQWAGDAGGTPRRTLEPDERAFLECRRSSFDSEPLREPDAVDVFRADGGDAAVLNIPWPKYGPDNSPVLTLEEVRQQIDTEVARLRNEVNALEARTRELEQEPVDFGPPKVMDFDRVHQAPSAGIVSATITTTGAGTIGAVCGWVADRESSLSQEARARNGLLLSKATVHYSDGYTRLGDAGMSMPVGKGQFWIVGRCGGVPTDTTIVTYFSPLGMGSGQ